MIDWKNFVRDLDEWVRMPMGNLYRLPVVGLVLLGLTGLEGGSAQGARGNAENGRLLYEEHCQECHGKAGDGRGAVGKILDEQPADFHAPDSRLKTERQLFNIIRYGRSIEMHPWERVLTDQEIWDVVTYIRILAPPMPAKEGGKPPRSLQGEGE